MKSIIWMNATYISTKSIIKSSSIQSALLAKCTLNEIISTVLLKIIRYIYTVTSTYCSTFIPTDFQHKVHFKN